VVSEATASAPTVVLSCAASAAFSWLKSHVDSEKAIVGEIAIRGLIDDLEGRIGRGGVHHQRLEILLRRYDRGLDAPLRTAFLVAPRS
jgi:hypothetical protein